MTGPKTGGRSSSDGRTQPLFCLQCGKPIVDSSKYCGSCGVVSENGSAKPIIADFVASLTSSPPKLLLGTLLELEISKFSFGPEETNDWTEEQLNKELSSSIKPIFPQLSAYKLDDLTIEKIENMNKESKQLSAWIFNQGSVEIILTFFPALPNERADKKLAWFFFHNLFSSRGGGPNCLVNNKEGVVFLQPTDDQASILRRAGFLCKPRPTAKVNWPGGYMTLTGFPMYIVKAPPSGTASIWDSRMPSSYFANPRPQQSPAFPRILKWWTPSHDAILARQITEKQWSWRLGVEEIVESTPSEVIAEFKTQKDDPHVWYNVLGHFAEWRAFELGLDKTVKIWPVWRKCAACGMVFHESSARVERLGLEQIDICTPCLRPLITTPSESMTKEEVMKYLCALTDLIERVPPSDFGGQQDVLLGLSTPKRVAVLRLLSQRPSLQSVNRIFRSWFAALVASGILADGARRGIYGTECLAKDGHKCLSLAEKTIDDFLAAEGVAHEKEVPYPDGAYRADFCVRETFIEYFGLQAQEEYAMKTKRKIELCQRAGIQLIEIYPEDLVDSARLRRKLVGVLNKLEPQR